MKNSKTTARVIGAGITGVTTAYYLARAGYAVEVYDKRPYPAMATSYANGGQLSASNAETWNSWSNVVKGAKWLMQSDAPLKINPSPELAKYSWFYKFIREIPNKQANTIKTCEMALAGHLLYDEMVLDLGIDYDRVKKGILHVYETEKELKHAREVNKWYTQAGMVRKEVTAEEARAIEPALDNPRIIGGFYNEQDYTGDIHLFCMRAMEAMAKKYDVKFVNKEAHVYHDIIRHPGPVVVCAGVESTRIARAIGDKHLPPIYPVKGYSITINDPGIAPWVSLLDDEAKIVTARLGEGRLRIAGTAEFNGYNRDIIQERVRPLKQWATKMFPGINMESVVPWAGLRPMTPSMMPIVEASKRMHGNIWYNTGHGHLGWTLSAYTAKNIVDQIKT